MNWNESNNAIIALKAKICLLPMRTKDNYKEYEALAKPLRIEGIELHKIRINMNITKQYG